MDIQAVYTVLVGALYPGQDMFFLYVIFTSSRTWGGPSIVPFQFDINKSSPSDRPYEQASKAYKSVCSVLMLLILCHTCPQSFLALL